MIRDPRKLVGYLAGIARNHGIDLVAAGGMGDHMHVLFLLPSTMAVAKAVQTLKANSSRWLNEQSRGFDWQKGYAAFGVSPSQLASVREYVVNQAEHHRARTVDQELVAMLKKAGIEYDPRYVFD